MVRTARSKTGGKAKTKAKAETKTKTKTKPNTKPKPKAAARTATKSVAKAAAKPRSAAPPKQAFTVSHYRDEDFAEGLRAYAQYRDLGIAKATHGMVRAHVIRLIGPCDPDEVSKLHYHDVDFQMVYVLKGWIKTELEGQGTILMRTGSCWIQPPRIKHVVHDYSGDCELLEIILPADFKTVEL